MLITFDTQSLTNDLLLSQDQVKNLIDFSIKEITASFAQAWEKTANTTLHSAREKYVNSIIVVDEGYAKGAVVLVGDFVNGLEEGIPEHDMKSDFLNGPNAKTGKNGKKYNTIPFKFGAPTSIESNFNGGLLPPEIHAIVKKKPANVPLVKDELPQKWKEPAKSSVKSESSKFKQYTHKSSIFEGVSRTQDEKTGQNSYKSFRRVSENSDPNSWIYPAVEGKHLAEATLQDFNVPFEVGRAIDKFLAQNQ